MSLFNQEQSDAYDARVRRLFGAFDEMHRLAAAEVALRHPQNILCLGAGKGEEVGHILRLLPDAKIVAIDPSPDMVIGGKERFPSTTWIQGTSADMPMGPFDAATYHLVTHFLDDEDVQNSFADLSSRVPAGKRLVVSSVVGDGLPEVWDVWEREASERILPERIRITRQNFADHCQFRPISQYEKWLEAAGFTGFRLFFRYGLFAGFVVQRG